MKNRTLSNLQKRLELAELVHLRQLAEELNERAEKAEQRADKAEAELDSAWESANFWNRFAMDQQDDDFHTHRQIGITRSGELMVVRGAQ